MVPYFIKNNFSYLFNNSYFFFCILAFALGKKSKFYQILTMEFWFYTLEAFLLKLILCKKFV